MPLKIVNNTKTKVLLTLTLEQKEQISQLAQAKGLSLSAFLRLKALEDFQAEFSDKSNNISKIKQYLSKQAKIPKKFKEYKNFEDFHKTNYKP